MMLNVELDEAIAAQLESAARARGVSAREFIRATLEQAAMRPAPVGSCARYSQKVHDFGMHIDSPWTVLAEIESDEYVRKFGRK